MASDNATYRAGNGEIGMILIGMRRLENPRRTTRSFTLVSDRSSVEFAREIVSQHPPCDAFSQR
jgi:hypothetical protein